MSRFVSSGPAVRLPPTRANIAADTVIRSGCLTLPEDRYCVQDKPEDRYCVQDKIERTANQAYNYGVIKTKGGSW